MHIPTEDDSMPVITRVAREAMADVLDSIRGYVTGRFWIVGKCVLAARAKFGSNKIAFKKWRLNLKIEAWTLSRAIGYAECFSTLEEASKIGVAEANKMVKDHRNRAPKKAQPLDLTCRLALVADKINDVEDGLKEAADPEFVSHYQRLEELRTQIERMLAKNQKRYARLTSVQKRKGVAA